MQKVVNIHNNGNYLRRVFHDILLAVNRAEEEQR